MTQMLASVSSLAEAVIALETGVDIVDLKNPATGALGALSHEEIRAIVDAVAGVKPVSATIGDLPMDPELLMFDAAHTAQTGVDFIKIGFFGSNGHRSCIRALKPLADTDTRLVAVLFADQEHDFSLLLELKQAGFYGVMLDTAEKNGNNLLDYITPEKIRSFILMAKSYGLQSGLAGSLKQRHIPSLAKLQPDYLGFRGAICINLQRTSALSKNKLQDVRALLLKNNIVFSNMISR